MSTVVTSRSARGLFFVLCTALLGCNPIASTKPASGKRLVVVSVVPQAWLVRQIGRSYIDVLPLVQPVDNPHTYQPSDSQVSRVMQADVYFRIGMPLENGSWFQAIQSSGRLSILDTRQGIELRRMESHAHQEAAAQQAERHEPADGTEHAHTDEPQGRDPHIWLSPRLLKIQARTIAQSLGRIDPAHRADYDRNLLDVQRQLDQLDAQLRRKLASSRGKSFFVFHPAWGYFADDYGLHQVAIEIEGKQPTDAELTELQAEARRLGVKVIFVQPQIAGQAAAAVAAAVGARLETLNPQAEDVPGCLLHAAEAIAQSYQDKIEASR